MRKLITLLVISLLTFTNAAFSQTVDFSISPQTTNVVMGDQFCLDVVVSDFTDMVSMQFSINYGDAAIEYDMATNFNLPGLGGSNVGNPSPGNITVSWLADDIVNGETVPDGTSIFQICFEAITANATSDIDFSGSPTSMEVTNTDGLVTMNTTSGEVIVGSGGVMDLTFTMPDLSGANGTNICVPVSVENFDDIVSMQFSMNYDASILTYTGSQNYGLGGLGGSNIGNPSAGNVTVSWLADDIVNGETAPDGTTIFEICFDIIGSGGQVSDMDFSGSPTSIEITNTDGLVTAVFEDGSVTATGGGGGSMDLTFTMPDLSGANGTNICVPVSVENFDDIVSMQYSMNYDASILTYTGSQNYGIGGMNASNVGNPSAGNVTVSWLADDIVNGETAPDGTTIFEICFDIIGSGGQVSDMDFSGSPTSIEVTNTDGLVTPVFEDGSVTATGGGGGSMDLTFTMPDLSGDNGDNICIPVTVENFDDIVSMQFSMNYDASILSYTGSQNYGIGGMNASNVGNPSAGNVTVSWLADDIVNGETAPDGTTIFEICFDIIGSAGQVSDMDFSGSPTSIEVTNTDGLVTPVFEDGSVTVNGGGGGPMDLTFTMPDLSGDNGDNICIPVTVENFDDIVSMQFSMNYDASILSYTGSQNYGIGGMNASNVGNPSAGNVTVSWLADDIVNGETAPDGTTIFEICFDIIGSAGQVSDMDFSGSPTSIEVTNTDGLVTPVFEDGSVTVNGGGGGPMDLTFIAPDLSADNGDNICVPITVENFDDIVSVQYSINYNSSILSYTGSQNYGLSGLNGSSIGNPSAGNVTLSWVADDVVNGASVADGTTIFEICFDVIGSAGQVSPIDFSGSPTSIEVTNTDGLITPVFEDGSVTVNGGGGGPSDFLLTIEDILVENGDDFCISVTADGFDSIVSMQFSINYDETMLEFTNTGNYQLPGLNGVNIGNPSPGNLTLSWVSNDVVNGETLPDGSVLFDICFTALAPNCSATQVEFSGSPTSIEVTDVNGSVDFDSEGSIVNICDGPPPVPFSIIASDELVGAGESICVDITVQGFIDMVSMQGSINYNPTILQYTGAQDPGNLPGLDLNNVANPSAGNITFLWIADLPAQGETLPDNTVILQLCFDAIGDLGDISQINFSGTPTPEEYTNLDGLINPVFVDGSVEIFEEVCNPILVTDVIVDPCAGTNTGSIDLTVGGGNDAYSYSWDYLGSTSQDLNNLAAGSYTVTITSCVETFTETYIVSELPAIEITGEFVTDVACFGEASGAIFLNVVGAQPFEFNWTGSGPISDPDEQNLINLETGNYSVTIIDENDCTLEAGPYNVDQPSSALGASVSNVEDVTCAGDGDGAISLSVSGGTPSYDYTWTPALPNTPNPSNIDGGNYSVEIEDMNGCIFEITGIPVDEPDPININIDVVQNETAAGEDGSISVTVSGGTGSLGYLWTGPDTDAPFITQDISGLIAGEYTLLVTDINGCQEEITVEVIKPLSVTIVMVTPSCFEEMDGGIDIDISGGCEPYTVTYDGPGSPVANADGDLENAAGGSYQVTVVDCVGDQVSFQVNVFEPSEPVGLANFSIVDVSSLGNCDGSVTVMGMGGTGPYMYAWSNGPSGPINNGLCVGTYQLTIEDQNGCTFDTSFMVSYVPPPLVQDANTPVDVACFGEDSGGWLVAVEGGCPPYEFNFSDIGIIISNDGEVTRTDLIAGNYCVTVTDNCSNPQEVEICTDIDQLPPIEIIDVVIYPNTTGSNGSIDITVQGGDFPYFYQWSGGGSTDLPEGCYDVFIEDDNGCEFISDEYCIPTLEVVEDEVNSVFCSSDSDGSILVNINGGINPPLTIEWFDGLGNPISADSNFVENLEPGTYSAVVTDALGVTSLPMVFTIDFSSDILASAEADFPVEFNSYNVSCADSEDGTAIASGANGQAPYSYEWCDGLGGNNLLDGLGAGTYCVIVTDQLGCIDTAEVVLIAPDPIQVVDDNLNVPCYGELDGRAGVKVFGGVPEYEYSWDDFMAQPTNPAILLEAGIYTVTITDENGCTFIHTTEVTEPDSLTLELIVTDDSGEKDGSVAAIVGGGSEPYSYLWSNGEEGNVIENLEAAEYFVSVTDANGCVIEGGTVVYNSGIDCLAYREVISADADGKNDELIINCHLLYETNRLEIYNRWGQLVYQIEQYDNDWSGTNQGGEDVPEGVYYFIFEYMDLDGVLKQMKGHVTVLR